MFEYLSTLKGVLPGAVTIASIMAFFLSTAAAQSGSGTVLITEPFVHGTQDEISLLRPLAQQLGDGLQDELIARSKQREDRPFELLATAYSCAPDDCACREKIAKKLRVGSILSIVIHAASPRKIVVEHWRRCQQLNQIELSLPAKLDEPATRKLGMHLGRRMNGEQEGVLLVRSPQRRAAFVQLHYVEGDTRITQELPADQPIYLKPGVYEIALKLGSEIHPQESVRILDGQSIERTARLRQVEQRQDLSAQVGATWYVGRESASNARQLSGQVGYWLGIANLSASLSIGNERRGAALIGVSTHMDTNVVLSAATGVGFVDTSETSPQLVLPAEAQLTLRGTLTLSMFAGVSVHERLEDNYKPRQIFDSMELGVKLKLFDERKAANGFGLGVSARETNTGQFVGFSLFWAIGSR